jgi:hypothetical protein
MEHHQRRRRRRAARGRLRGRARCCRALHDLAVPRPRARAGPGRSQGRPVRRPTRGVRGAHRDRLGERPRADRTRPRPCRRGSRSHRARNRGRVRRRERLRARLGRWAGRPGRLRRERDGRRRAGPGRRSKGRSAGGRPSRAPRPSLSSPSSLFWCARRHRGRPFTRARPPSASSWPTGASTGCPRRTWPRSGSTP